MEQKQVQNELASAFVSAFAEIDNVVKNAANPHFGSNYADLGAVLDTVRPVFARNGLAVLMAPGNLEGDRVSLTWTLFHKSGQCIGGQMQLPIGQKNTAQAAGSCITYMRRYMLAALAGIAQVDDDGNAASASPPHPKAAKPAARTVQADASTDLTTRIGACSSLEALEALKVEVAEVGEQEVANAYIAKKKELKGTKK
jgi:hypothetical protein